MNYEFLCIITCLLSVFYIINEHYCVLRTQAKRKKEEEIRWKERKREEENQEDEDEEIKRAIVKVFQRYRE